MAYEAVYDKRGVVAWMVSSGSVCITAPGQRIYLTPEELDNIAEAVVQYVESQEPLFTEEDLEVGRQAIKEYCDFTWPPQHNDHTGGD